MAGEVGNLTVNLGLNAAGFSGGITEASKNADKLRQHIKNTMDQSKYSTMEARHALMMLGEEFGVHIPRGIQMMLANLAPVGGLLAAAFPIIAATAAVAIIAKLITKHEELATALRKTTTEADNLAVKQADDTKALEVTNLKLDDQIAKLTHSPGNNALKEMIIEDSEAVDKLASSFDSDFAKIDDKLTEATTLTGTLTQGWRNFQKARESGRGIVGGVKDTEAESSAIHGLQLELVKVADIRRHLADAAPGSAAAKDLIKQLGDAYKDVETKATAAEGTIKNDPALLIQVGEAATSAANAYKNLALQNEIAAKHKVIKPLEDAEKLAKDNAELASSTWKVTDAFMQFGVAQRKIAAGFKDEKGDAATKQTIADFKQMVDSAKEAGAASLEETKATARGEEEIASATTARRMTLIKDQEATFRISKRQELQAEIDEENSAYSAKVASIEKIAAAERGALQQQIDAAQRARANTLALPGVTQHDPAVLAYDREINDLLAKQGAIGTKANADIQAATIRTGTTVQHLNSEIEMASHSWTEWAAQGMQGMSLIEKASKNMQQNVDTAISGIGNGFAKAIVEGKNLGQAMKNVAKEMAESFISSTIQMLIHYVIMKAGMGAIDKAIKAQAAAEAAATHAAQVASSVGIAAAGAAAETFATTPPLAWAAAVPAAITLATTTTTAAGAAEQGGLVGYDDMIIAAHKNEMVLPSHLSQKVQDMTEPNKGGTHVHVTYSPTVHAIDGKGMSHALEEHSRIIQAHVQKALRRTNK